MTGQQFPTPQFPGRGPRRPAGDVPFFAPAAGEFGTVPPPPGVWGTAGTAGTAVPHRVDLEPLGGLGRAAVVLAVVVSAGDVLSALAEFGGDDSLLAGLVSLLGLLAYLGGLLANWIVVALWTSRARRNAARLAPGFPHRRAAAWAWFGWIVPIAWLFVPRQVVQDVWTASRGGALRGADPRIGLWWGFWVAGMLLGGAAFRLSVEGAGGAADALGLLSALVWAAGIPFFRTVLRTVAQAQDGVR
ncbi:DUF4328 domain-containing protein [Kineococcus rhizosphaerae]|uniref:Uncharacterized protein DUF4328 n=1 Tax=Kineococcus rhizosphaerae TaxID=559628 RepID=A0A2T0R899_9ACTN|nr:DUF4328 domain-containing protein [Kineococcus rhizosphaerae]PRY17387.1 uncharacterized protein DUF4328 [Kineococcus rhizosphaerae]